MRKQLSHIHCPACGWWWVTQGSICSSCNAKLNNKKKKKIMFSFTRKDDTRQAVNVEPLDTNRTFSLVCMWCNEPIDNDRYPETLGGEPIHINCLLELCEVVREDEEEGLLNEKI